MLIKMKLFMTIETFILEASCHISHCFYRKVSASIPDDQDGLKKRRQRLYKVIWENQF